MVRLEGFDHTYCCLRLKYRDVIYIPLVDLGHLYQRQMCGTSLQFENTCEWSWCYPSRAALSSREVITLLLIVCSTLSSIQLSAWACH